MSLNPGDVDAALADAATLALLRALAAGAGYTPANDNGRC